MILFIASLFAFLVLFACLFVIRFGQKWNLSPFVAFSSGGLLALALLDFLPHSFQESTFHPEIWILMGLLMQGAFDLYGSKYLNFLDNWIEEPPHSNTCKDDSHSGHYHSHILSPEAAVSTMGCLTICSFFDGMRFYSGLTLDSLTGITLGIGLFFHLLAEGVTVTGLGVSSRLKRKILFALVACLCGSFIVGASLTKVLSDFWNAPAVFAFATGILIYVCTIHLIPFCLKNRKEGWFAVGLVIFSIIHLFHGH
ncbi:MAG: hypothetical protein OXB86_05980 [Bdellovibrionales bacterium]|nr:hypothetical protein [Bdellovibrionales bacterium]